MGAHATRSASGNKRWMSCAGSIRMSKGRPNNSSEAARLGTAAHGLGEYCLRYAVMPVGMLGGVVCLDDEEDASVFNPPDPDSPGLIDLTEYPLGSQYPIDENMANAVQVYVETVLDEMERRPGAELLIEHRSSLNSIIGYDWDGEVWPETSALGMYTKPGPDCGEVVYNADGTESAGPMFGTNDAAVFQVFEHLTIIDYKHGQGVVVEAAEVLAVQDDGSEVISADMKGNSQLMQYALGIAIDKEWAFETLDIVVVQPRARHAEGGVRRYSTNVEELKAFQSELVIAADLVEKPDAPLKAGSWCQFCPAAGIPCPELHRKAIEMAQVDFSDGEPQVAVVDEGTSDALLESALAVIPLLDVYIKKVREESMRRLRESPDGTGFGYKLVRGKSNRKWFDDALAVDGLIAKGYPRDMLYEAPKLKTPSKVEALRPLELIASLKAGGVKAPVGALKAIVSDFSIKPDGKIVVAPMADPRDVVPPGCAAAADFEVYEGED